MLGRWQGMFISIVMNGSLSCVQEGLSKREKHGMCFSPKSVNHGGMSQHVLDGSVSAMCSHYAPFVWTWAHLFPNA